MYKALVRPHLEFGNVIWGQVWQNWPTPCWTRPTESYSPGFIQTQTTRGVPGHTGPVIDVLLTTSRWHDPGLPDPPWGSGHRPRRVFHSGHIWVNARSLIETQGAHSPQPRDRLSVLESSMTGTACHHLLSTSPPSPSSNLDWMPTGQASGTWCLTRERQVSWD